MAWVKLKEGKKSAEDEIRDYRREKIATYKIPRYLRFTDEFPITVTGKLQKFKLRDQAIEAFGLQQAASIETA